MYHSRFKGTHYDAGFRYGTILSKNKVNLETIFKPFRDSKRDQYVKDCITIYQEYYPEILEEIKGVADGQKINEEVLLHFLLTMYSYTADNFCTSFAVQKGNQLYFGRNSDFVWALEKTFESCFYQLNNGYRFIGNTTALIQMEDGINEFGLAVGLTFIIPTIKAPGFNAGFLVRYLLEKCQNADEALQALKKLPIGSTQTLIIADRLGKKVLVECNCEEMSIQEVNGDGFVLATNDFHLPEMIKYQATIEDTIYSHDRYQTAHHALTNCTTLDLDFMQDLLSGKFGMMCQYDRSLGMDTVWSSIYHLTSGDIYRVEGNPSRKKFKKDERLKIK